MSQKTSCFDIFLGRSPVASLERFCEQFGPYPWVRLVGLNELLSFFNLVGTFPSIIVLRRLVREELHHAVTDIKSEGAKLFSKGDWESCNAVQLRNALNGKAMCIEKAIIVARAVERASTKALKQFKIPPINVLEHLSIHPSNCVVEGLEEWKACQRWPRRFFAEELAFLDALEDALRPHARKGKNQRRHGEQPPDRKAGFDEQHEFDQLILAVMEGKAITWKSASLLKDAFGRALGPTVTIKVLRSRESGHGLHACTNLEAPFIGLAFGEHDRLREALGVESTLFQSGR